jgi:hypothetical protein
MSADRSPQRRPTLTHTAVRDDDVSLRPSQRRSLLQLPCVLRRPRGPTAHLGASLHSEAPRRRARSDTGLLHALWVLRPNCLDTRLVSTRPAHVLDFVAHEEQPGMQATCTNEIPLYPCRFVASTGGRAMKPTMPAFSGLSGLTNCTCLGVVPVMRGLQRREG